MPISSPRWCLAVLLFCLPFSRLAAQDLVLSSTTGASIRFAQTGETWRWAGLTTPSSATEIAITEEATPLSVKAADDMLAAGWTLAEQDATRLVFEQDAVTADLRVRRVFSFGPAKNVVRIETWVRNNGTEKTLTRAGLLDLRIENEAFREMGAAPFSFPLFGQSMFVGIEHVSGICRTTGDSAHLHQTPHLRVTENWQFVAAAIVGWPMPTNCSLFTGEARMREAFIQYLDTIRVKPADFELHTNTWWTLPLPFSEKDVLRDIELLRKGFFDRTGMFFDSFALDLGWSNPRSIWRVDSGRFPNELRTINDSLATMNSRLGLWLSPGSAYAPGLDNTWLESNGYEVTPFGDNNDPIPKVACFALGGKYQTAVKESIVQYARDYGLRHVKLDFMAHSCDVPTHGHPVGWDSVHAIDAGLADVLDSLRAVNPAMALEPLCTGYPPSPWWVTKTPYVLGPYGDDVPYGRVPSPDWMESLISARDIAYRADRDRWIMPSQSLETIDIVVQSPGDFENLAVMAIGRGRWFISTYLKPELMSEQNWDFLASLVKWARANKQYLGNALTIGGRPENREAYGYLFHNADKDIYCLRNPWMEARTIELPVCESIREARVVRMIYPRREIVAEIQPGAEKPRIVLAPYETVMLETVSASEAGGSVAQHPRPEAVVNPAEPYVEVVRPSDPERASSLFYSWDGTLSVPDVMGAELCILVEGAPQVENSRCTVLVSGQALRARSAGNAGQFGAAAAPSPENWTWFFVPLTPGDHSVRIEIDVPLENAAIGVFLRGATSAVPGYEASETAPFPLYRSDRRAWSQAVLRMKDYATEAPPAAESGN
ncbi:MAG TPA: hypothetical protein VM029_22965 [Opitutaceae bacterium]|nr:hypothetical protein [Opitutaceae bacterium]